MSALSIIDRILALEGEMPDPVRHRRYLESLTVRALSERVDALQASNAVFGHRQRDVASSYGERAAA